MDEQMMQKVTQRVIELGDRKEFVSLDELPYIVADVLNSEQDEQSIKILNYSLSLTYGLRPIASVKMSINGVEYEQSSSGAGQYNAMFPISLPMGACWIIERLGTWTKPPLKAILKMSI